MLARMMRAVTALIVMGLCAPVASSTAEPAQPAASTAPTDYVILFVLEGVEQSALKAGPMPVLARFVKEGAVTWTATSVKPAQRLPTMASLVTGMPVEKHGINWNTFDFIRGYPRPPTVFDYLDLSGGKDSAIFFMDESLYQLAKPEPYTDYQMCGPLKPECNTATMVGYINQYFRKATSGQGYGHAIFSLPHFLVVHLPESGRAGLAHGWNGKAYKESLRSVDGAMGSILGIYRDLGLLKHTTVFVTAINGEDTGRPGDMKANGVSAPRLPWIAWGSGIKAGYHIKQPVSIIDTGATVMRTLGLKTHTEWESHAVEEIFKAPSMANARSSEPEGPPSN
jgi:hypothetical protein